MDRSVTIRAAAANEMAVVAGLFRDYAASIGVDLSYQGFEAECATLPGAYAAPRGALLLAFDAGGTALGCVAIRPLSEPDTCEMKRLHLCPAARGTGIGRALATTAVETARKAGYHAMRLDTLPTMIAARALYGRLGFETTPPYYATPVIGTIFMRKKLDGP
jgi:ribosomal protein S18 acetylase RimI-like enzyme